MKKLRGNQAKIMTKDPRKAIMDRSRFENNYQNGHRVKTSWNIKRQKTFETR